MIDKPASGRKLPLAKLKHFKMKKIIEHIMMTLILMLMMSISNAQNNGFNSRYRVAVMPLVYMGDGSEGREEEMRYQLQDIVVSYMSRSSAELKFMDAAEINAVLYKKGVNADNIRQYTPRELAQLLHAEYVIMGSVIQDPGNIVTTENRYNSRRETVERGRRYDASPRCRRRPWERNRVAQFLRRHHRGRVDSGPQRHFRQRAAGHFR